MKRMIAIGIALCLCAGLCACGGDAPQESRVPSTEDTTIAAVGTTTTTAANATTDATREQADTTREQAGTTQEHGDITTAVADTTTAAVVGTTVTPDNGPATTTAVVPSASATIAATSAATTTTTTATTTTKITTTTTTTKPTALLQQGDLTGKTLRVGDRMYDITVTDTDGNAITLSRLLQDKEMVVLNFWFINCSFCIKEFPVMSDFYGKYGDRVGMVALNPIDGAVNTDQFRKDNADLLFPMAVCPYAWAQAFGITAYPTSVVIDKQGIIRKIHVGALVKESDWVGLYNQYR